MVLLRRIIAVCGHIWLTALLVCLSASSSLAQLATPIFPGGQPVLTANPPPPWSKGQTVNFSITVNNFDDSPLYPGLGFGISQFFHGLGIHSGSCWTNITLGTPPPALNYTNVGQWIVDANQPVLGFYFDSDNCDLFCPINNDSRNNWGDFDPFNLFNRAGPWVFSWSATINAADPDTCSACMQAEVFVDGQTGSWDDDFLPDPRIGDYCDVIGILLGSPVCRDSITPAVAFRRIKTNYTQTWEFDSAQVLSGAGNGPYDLRWTTPGLRRVTHTVTDTLLGITAVDTAIIEIGNRPTSLFGVSKSTLCAEIDTVTVTYLGTGSPFALYNWDFDGANIISGSGQGPYRLVWPTAGTKSISLIVGATNCQSDSTIVNLSVGDTANFNLVYTPFICIDSAAIIISNFCAPPDGKSFSWDLGGGILVSGSGAGPIYVRWSTQGTKRVIRFTRDLLSGTILSRDTIEIGVLPPLTNTFTVSDLSVCEGEEVLITYTGSSIPFINIFNWDFAGGIVVSGSGAGPYRVRWNSPGPKNITLLVRYPFVNCNSPTNVQTVMVSPTPAPAISVTGGFCVSDTIQVAYTAPGAVLVNWDYDGGTVIFGGTSDIGPHFIKYSTPGVKNIRMTVTSGSCTISQVQALNIGEIPALSAGPDVEICGGGLDFTPLLATVNGNAATCTYRWSPAAGLSDPNAQQPLANPTQTTEYQVVAICPCGNDTDYVNVTVKPSPTWTSAPATFEVCEGTGGTQLNLVANSGGGNLLYTWSPDSGLSNPNIANPIANPSVTTVYTVRAVDANGCASPTLRITVQVNDRPFVNLGPDTTICAQGTPYTFSPQVSGGSGNYGYQWSPATGLSCTNCATPVLTPGASNTYTLVVTDLTTGCVSAIADTLADIKVDVVTEPEVAVSAGTVQVCAGDSVRIGALPVSGGVFNYEWTPATGLSDAFAQFPMASPAATTVYTVRGVVGGCIGQTQTVTVEVMPVPTLVAVSPTLGICPKDSVQLEILLSGQQTLDSVLWTPSTGLSNPRALQPMASPDSTTDYLLTIYANGCSLPIQEQITVSVSPVPFVDADTTNSPVGVFYCLGDPIGVTLPAKIDTSFSGNFRWSPAAGLSSTATLNPTAKPTQTTKYFLTLTSGGCSVVDSVEVVVLPGVDITLTASDNRVCAGEPVQLEATAGIGAARFVWSPATGLSNPNIANPIATPLVTTWYYVRATESGCNDLDSVLITVDPQARADFSSTQVGGCGQMTVLFRDQSTDAVGWRWDFGDNSPIDTNQNPTHVYNQAGSYTVTLIANGLGSVCNDTIVKAAYVLLGDSLAGGFISNPDVGDTLYLPNATLTVRDTTTNAISWLWLFGDGGSASGISATHTYQTPGQYMVSLIVTDANGCLDTIQRGPYVVIAPPIGFIPNVFTPNGDGSHDVFRISYDGNLPYELVIYDRWGISLYNSTDPTEGWNGLANNSGGEAADGVYFYVLNVGDQRIKGTVTLIR